MATEAYAVLVTIGLGWVGWISLTTINNSNKINSLMQLPNEMTEIKEIVRGTNDRLDIFLKNELDTLKKIAEK